MDRTILIIDDEPQILGSLKRFFERKRWNALTATDGESGLRAYAESRPDVVLLDLGLPGLSGMETLRALRTQAPATPVLILTGRAEIATAVEAMGLGAENFLTKPVGLEHLEIAVERAFEKVDLRDRYRDLAARLSDSHDGLAGLGSSPAMLALAEQVRLVARSGDTTVVLYGESGTGKGWLARVLHDIGPRSGQPFMDINCAELSGTFLRSELFGHERGAFTDARERKRGLLEVANKGTVLLDEIGDLELETQPKLLTVLEERSFRRLGGTREIPLDVRVIAATNQDLRAKVDQGQFREDLFYRLNVMSLTLPALRERGQDDVLELASRLFAELSRRMGAKDAHLSVEVLEMLCAYAWPGNVRELRNVLERALILAGGPGAETISPHHLPAQVVDSSTPGVGRGQRSAPEPLEAVEARHIAKALAWFEGNRTRTAEALGVTRGTLLRKIAKYELE